MNFTKVQDNGDILLSPGELNNQKTPSGLLITHVVLSHEGLTVKWLIDFLTAEEREMDDWSVAEKKYDVRRSSEGTIFLREIRENGFVNYVGFSKEEIPNVLADLQHINL